ncbi:hypothetical protein ACHQM5_008767 [Ranunculus cassubicifolius]
MALINSLTAAGNPIHDTDLVFHILNGLPPQYDSFATSIRVRDPVVTSDELHSLLLIEELTIDARTKLNLSNDPSAFFTYHKQGPIFGNQNRGRGYSNHRGRGRGRSNNNRNNHNNYNQFSDSGLFSEPQTHPALLPQNKCASTYYHHLNNPPPKQDKTLCQICQIPGHLAIDCYNRLNLAYIGKTPPQKLKAMVAQREYHNSSVPSSSHSPWVLDTGATNHVTADASQFTDYSPYTGSDKLCVGNGDSIPIQNTGSSYLYTPHKKFLLTDILHAPNITHNLLSVHKLLTDNNCVILFTKSSFFVKDLDMNSTLLTGSHRDGLYQINQPSIQSVSPMFAFLGVKSTSALWHSRLGHPSTYVFHKISSLASLHIEGPKTSASQMYLLPLCKIKTSTF